MLSATPYFIIPHQLVPAFHYAAPARANVYHTAPAFHYAAPARAGVYHAAPALHYAAPARTGVPGKFSYGIIRL